MSNKRPLIYIILAIICIIIIVLLASGKKSPTTSPQPIFDPTDTNIPRGTLPTYAPPTIPSSEVSETPLPTPSQSQLQNYTDAHTGISFLYPSSWKVSTFSYCDNYFIVIDPTFSRTSNIDCSVDMGNEFGLVNIVNTTHDRDVLNTMNPETTIGKDNVVARYSAGQMSEAGSGEYVPDTREIMYTVGNSYTISYASWKPTSSEEQIFNTILDSITGLPNERVALAKATRAYTQNGGSYLELDYIQEFWQNDQIVTKNENPLLRIHPVSSTVTIHEDGGQAPITWDNLQQHVSEKPGDLTMTILLHDNIITDVWVR